MTIAGAFNEIAVAHGGTPSKSGTIAGAIDALNDALAGSDQPGASTIEGAVRLLGQHIGSGGGGGGGGIDVGDLVTPYETFDIPYVGMSASDILEGGFAFTGASIGETPIVDLPQFARADISQVAEGATAKGEYFGLDGDCDKCELYFVTSANDEIASVEKLNVSATKENVTYSGVTQYRYAFQVPEVPDGKYLVVYYELAD